MYGLSTQAIAQQVVEVWKALALAIWDVAAAEPKLQLMLVGFVVLALIGGGARGRARRVR